MAVYTTVSDAEIRDFLTRYPLGDLVCCQGIAEGVENSNYLLGTYKDGQDTRYILTIYEKRVNPADLPFFLRGMEHLARSGVPCPLPVYGNNGEIVQTLQRKPAAIVTFLNGRGVKSIRNAHVSALGEAMAGMHRAAEGFALTRANALSIKGWRPLFEKFAAQVDEISAGLHDLITDELNYLQTHWPHSLPQGIIHADLFPDNVFYEGDRLTGIIDFYFACNDYFVYDLAICMNAWCFEQKSEFNITKARQLLTAYYRVRALSEAELAALPILCRGSALRFLLTRAHDWIFRVEGALVTPKDPMEYVKKLRFHQQVTRHEEYGL